MTNDPLDPATAPYPSVGARSTDTAPAVDVDPRSTAAESRTAEDYDAGTTDAERPEYSVDQVGDDQAPVDTTRTADASYAAEDRAVDSAPVADDAAYPADADATPTTRNLDNEPLVPTTEGVDFKARWDVIQQGFVDDPRTAVTDADKLVGDVLDRLSTTFDEQHRTLEGQWSNGEPDTEALRSALQRYRAFFERLLTI
ncbi:hypothetical protein [Kribbella sp. NPDC051718]|uniref:hypothetical protein n=1 Tax=Kribbella sp. NPDC051718 TaxID=3155168 RepID=UPI0034331F25